MIWFLYKSTSAQLLLVWNKKSSTKEIGWYETKYRPDERIYSTQHVKWYSYNWILNSMRYIVEQANDYYATLYLCFTEFKSALNMVLYIGL